MTDPRTPRDPLSEIVVPAAQLPRPRHLFVGIRTSVATTNALSVAVETLARRARDARAELRWVAPTTYHVTLKYLGWAQPEIVPALIDTLEAAIAGTPRFVIRAGKLGGFPTLDAATVLWAGVEISAALTELAGKVDRAMVGLGFPAEARPFVPHITIARTETRVLRDLVLPVSEQMFSETKVDGITLIETETRSQGSVYSDVRKIAFKSAETGPISAGERQRSPLDMDAPHAETDDGWPRGQGPE